MDRLIFKQIDFNHTPVSAAQREAARRTKGYKVPRKMESYRAFLRNSRSHTQRANPSTEKGFMGPISLNRSKHWLPADNYFDARDLSQSSREVV